MEVRLPKILNQDITKYIQYENLASVLRHCDNNVPGPTLNRTIQANAGRMTAPRTVTRENDRKENVASSPLILVEGFRIYKSKHQYRSCRNHGHFRSNHNKDGSLKPRFESRAQPVHPRATSSRGQQQVPNDTGLWVPKTYHAICFKIGNLFMTKVSKSPHFSCKA